MKVNNTRADCEEEKKKKKKKNTPVLSRQRIWCLGDVRCDAGRPERLHRVSVKLLSREVCNTFFEGEEKPI